MKAIIAGDRHTTAIKASGVNVMVPLALSGSGHRGFDAQKAQQTAALDRSIVT